MPFLINKVLVILKGFFVDSALKVRVAQQLRNSMAIEQLMQIVSEMNLAPQKLQVEITETAAIEDLDQSISFVDTLKELGCGVAIDDFGTGYTSFRNLKFLGANMLKIDGTFVKNLLNDAADQVFIKTVVELADAFGMETVAEWVGDDATAALLADAGITYMQGFHFGEPELVNWLDRSGS